MKKGINYFTSDKKITLYWSKDNKYDDYLVMVNDKKYLCKETFLNIKNATSNSSYKVSLYGVKSKKKTLLDTQILKTKKTKNKIVIKPSKDDTKTIQQALDTCTKNDVVYISKGDYHVKTLRLHSDTELYLAKGANLIGSNKIKDYLPLINSRFEGIERKCYSSILNIGELDKDKITIKNVYVHGEGAIIGGGQKLAAAIIKDEKKKHKNFLSLHKAYVQTCENDNTIPGRIRPRLINISSAKNVIFEGLSFINAPAWTFHMIYSDNVITCNCLFKSEKVWNGDGWDPDSSTNCTLFNSKCYTSDDAVAIKSGKNPEGNVINKPTKHINIFSCYVYSDHGMAIGTEMSGGVSDVNIWDCDLTNGQLGIELKTTYKRGGYITGVSIDNCKMPCFLVHSVGYNNDGKGAPKPPYIKDITVNNCHINGVYSDINTKKKVKCKPVLIEGFSEDNNLFKDIKLTNNTIKRANEIIVKDCHNVVIK